MFDTFSILLILVGISLLVVLSIIDLRTFLLPNIYVAPFALLGIGFHAINDFYYLDLWQVMAGGVAGYSILYVIRAGGNKYYGQDSLGLGDVKLLGAGGLWLGFEGVLFAMTLGAFAGLIHGLIYALYLKMTTKQPFSLSRLTIPAGPGFALGIILVGSWMYKSLVMSVFYDFFP